MQVRYPLVSCKINRRRLRYVLVDSGAPTCITWDTLWHLYLSAPPALEPPEKELKDFNGRVVPCRGMVTLTFSCGDWVEENIKVYVVGNAPSSFVIGNDLLALAGSTKIDWDNQKITFGTHAQVDFDKFSARTPITRHTANVSTQRISTHVLRTVTLPPWTANYVQVYHAGDDPRVERSYYGDTRMHFDPDAHFMERHSAYIEAGLQDASSYTSAVFVSNFSDKAQRLHAGDVLGQLDVVTETKELLEINFDDIAKLLTPTEVPSARPSDGTSASVSASAPGERRAATVGEKDRTADDIAEPPLGPSKAEVKFDINPDLPEAEKARIYALLLDVLKLAPADSVGKSKAPPMEIKLKPGAVINNRSYPQRLEAQLEMLKIAAKMHAGGVLRPSVSPYNSPVVLARKADGTWRFCVDYRQVNAATIRDAYQLPRPNDLLARLGGASIFSVLDLASAFWQVRLAEEAKQFTAFSLLSGHWEFEMVPMGLTNSPPWMQRSLEGALGDILYRGALAYIDDIIVYGRTFDEHYARLEVVLTRLRDYGFSTRPDKCKFGYEEVKFLGHLVGKDGLRPSLKNLDKIRDCKLPTDNKQLESCLALFSYYRRFIKNYADISRPLTECLTAAQRRIEAAGRNPRRGKIDLVLSAREAEHFERLKAALCAPGNLLALPDFDEVFVLETDASDFFGHATLSQYDKERKLRPIEFHSFRIPSTIAKGVTYERELHAVMEGVRHFSHYLDFSQEFEVRIDHRSLQHLHDQAAVHAKYARHVQVLGVYNIRWVHQPAAQHRHIDAFTRPPFTPSPEELAADPALMGDFLDRDPHLRLRRCAICEANGADPLKCRLPIPGKDVFDRQVESIGAAVLVSATGGKAERRPLPLSIAEVQKHQRADSYLGEIFEALKTDPAKRLADINPEVRNASDNYLLAENGLLYFVSAPQRAKRRTGVLLPDSDTELPLAVPPTLVPQFLAAYHSDATAGHLGFKKALPRLARDCHWHRMATDLYDFEHKCESCMRGKVPRRGPVGKLHPISVAGVFDMLGMDILGPLPRTRRGYAYVIVFMDYASRYAVLQPLRTQTAAEVARVFVKRICLERAAPRRLLSDLGSAFVGQLMTEVYRVFGVHKVNTTAYHPQTDGMVERFNHTLVAMLAHYVGSELDDWDEYLPAVQFAYNTSRHATTGHVPHDVMYTWPALSPAMATLAAPLPGADPSRLLEKSKAHHEATLALIQKIDAEAKKRAAVRHDANSTPLVFAVGQFVFRKNERPRNKLDERLLGPYVVVDADVATDTYKIRPARDSNGRVDKVHVEKLYPTLIDYDPTEVDLHEDDASDASEADFEPSDGEDADDFTSARAPRASRRPAPSASAPPSAAPAAPAPRPPAAPAPSTSTSAADQHSAATRGSGLQQQLRELRNEVTELPPDKPVAPALLKAIKLTLENTFPAGGRDMKDIRVDLRCVHTHAELLALINAWCQRYHDV